MILYYPLLVAHIAGGTLSLLAGAAAMIYRKGSDRHRQAGNVFVISMLTLGASGTFLGLMKSQPSNVMAGAFTFYLVATSWWTARRREKETGIYDWAAFLGVLAFTTIEAIWAWQAGHSPTGLKYGYPPAPFILFGSVALLATIGDLRMLLRGGILGTQRLARHLWRMCFALFIASASVFLARPHLFPVWMRKSGTLALLTLLPLILLFFWLVRVRLAKAYKARPAPAAIHSYAVAAKPAMLPFSPADFRFSPAVPVPEHRWHGEPRR